MNKKAFTLIELLVLIVIVGILMAFLVPAFGKARAGARKAQCISNLRQIGTGMALYVDEHNFTFPPFASGMSRWWILLKPYIGDSNVFRCPEYAGHVYSETSPAWANFSYGLNRNGLNGPPGEWSAGLGINQVLYPSRCMMVLDSSSALYPDLSYDYVEKWPLYGRHSNGVNILFVDGHVAWHLVSDIPISFQPSDIPWWNYQGLDREE